MNKTIKNVSVDELKNDPILIMELMTTIFTGIPMEAALSLLCTTVDTVCEAAPREVVDKLRELRGKYDHFMIDAAIALIESLDARQDIMVYHYGY